MVHLCRFSAADTLQGLGSHRSRVGTLRQLGVDLQRMAHRANGTEVGLPLRVAHAKRRGVAVSIHQVSPAAAGLAARE